jgi:hypothetical protein
VRLINYPKVSACKAGETLINWNAKGPQGQVGPVGPVGPKGDPGPAGPADWNAIGNKPVGFADSVDNLGVTTVTLTRKTGSGTSVAVSDYGYAYVDCPTGSKITGGGALTDSQYLHLTDSYTVDGTRWWVSAHNADNSSNPVAHTVYAHAICMSVNDPGTITTASKGLKPAKLRKHK